MTSMPRPCGRLAFSFAAASLVQLACSGGGTPPSPSAQTPSPAADPCQIPTQPTSTPEETAWRIFVAINCPTGNPSRPLAWETWTEQNCIAKPTSPGCGGAAEGAAARKLHGSHLAHRKAITPSGQSGPPVASLCSPMTTTASAQTNAPSLVPFVPTNLSSNPQFCEEVYANSPEVTFIKTNNLQTLTGQAAYVNAGNTITFPTDAVEVKADWMPASSLNPPFTCSTPPAGVFVETIDDVCYALVGLHISSKLYPNWLWATFEPQSTVTNPNRCNPQLYGACNDPWGSNPATSTGRQTQITPQLQALMTQAKVPAVLQNYRLTGTQTDFSVPQLGSSFVEFNAQVAAQQASCITCHYYAQLKPTPPTENPNFGPFPGDPAVGQPTTVQAPWVQQDFSWLLGIMPPQ